MNSEKILTAIEQNTEPDFNNDTERCLWLAGTGKWEQSHDIVESLPEPDASWIHAMLHREEGDLGNAGYWYHRADQSMPPKGTSFREELKQISKSLLG